jgi:hypothetical protein
VKIEKSVKKLLNDEEKFGIKKFKTYQEFAKKVYKVRNNVIYENMFEQVIKKYKK